MGFSVWMNRTVAGGAIAVGLGLIPTAAGANVPIVPATDGTDTQVTIQGDRAVISGGQVSTDGANHFHSFTTFGVGTGQTAEFVGTPNLETILGRVVGGDPSLVDGTIRVTGTDANLFLLNPAGWIFGSGAQLDVPGAFTATTATTVGFEGGEVWGVGPGTAGALDAGGAIAGFYFEAGVSGNIANFGTLAVAPGQGLSLLGMTVLNGGQLVAPGGTVLVEAVPESGWVRLASTGMVLGLEFVPQDVPALSVGSVPSPLTLPELLTGGEVAAATGVTVADSGQITLGGTDIGIQGSELTAGTAIASGTLDVDSPTGIGGEVALLGDRIAILDGDITARGELGGGTLWIGGEGAGATGLPVAQQTVIDSQSLLDASALGLGDGGEIRLWSESATVFDGAIAATGGVLGGDGGFVEISGRDRLQVSGLVDVGAPAGALGSVLFDPENILIVADAPNATTADGDQAVSDGSIFLGDAIGETLTISQFTLQTITGDVTLEANSNITVADGVSLVFLGDPSSPGATQTVRFVADANQDGVGAFAMDPTQALVASDLNVFITGASVTVGDVLTSSVEGVGGNITLRASQGNLMAGVLDSSAESAAGGNITLEAPEGSITANTVLTLSASTANGGAVQATGNGPIAINTILTNSVGGQGGAVTLTSNTGALQVDGVDTSGLGDGNGGPITLMAEAGAIAFDSLNSQSNAGAGGAIAITAGGDITVGDLLFGTTGAAAADVVQPDATLNTPGNVNLSGATFNGGRAGVIVGSTAPVGGLILGSDPLSTSGTPFTLNLTNPAVLTAELNTAGGDLTINSDSDITLPNAITTQGGNLTVTANSLTASALIDASAPITNANGIPLPAGNRNGGTVQIETQGNLSTADIAARGADLGGTITLTSASGAIATGSLDVSSTEGTGGTISVTAPGTAITAAELAAINALVFDEEGILDPDSLVTGPPLGSLSGDVQTGDLSASGAINGGSVTIQARTRITAGAIEANGTQGNGGSVSIDPEGDVVLDSVNASGGTAGTGGTVAIASQRFVRVLNTLSTGASIAAAGGAGDGQITLSHGGSDAATPLPFNLGNPGINGSAGNLSVGSTTLTAPDEFLGPIQEGNISVVAGTVNGPNDMNMTDGDQDTTGDGPGTTPGTSPEDLIAPPPEVLDVLEVVSQTPEDATENNPINSPQGQAIAQVRDGGLIDPANGPLGGAPVPLSPRAANENIQQAERSLVSEFADFLGVEPQPEVSIPEAQVILRRIEQETGVKPALVYAQFRPTSAREQRAQQANRGITPAGLAGDRPTAVDQSLAGGEGQGLSTDPSLIASTSPGWNADSPTPVAQTLSQSSKENDGDILEILLVTAEGEPQLVPLRNVTRGLAVQRVRQLREFLTNPIFRQSPQYLKISQDLYQWFVAPLREELEFQGINNLTFVLGAGLRSMPLAALHDGEQFVIENFSVGLMPSLSLSNTKYQNIQTAPVLALGASEFLTLDPLPAVPQELELVTKERQPGQRFLNEGFTAANLKAARDDAPTPIVHLATHAEFRPGKASQSYIQLWGNEQVTLNRLGDLKLNLPTVNLLVLSACRTAVGDRNAELGFAGLAVASGVNTAIASLWYVSDKGTLGFMGELYEQLRTAPIKAEALRQTQLAMMRGEVRVENGQMTGSFGSITLDERLAGQGVEDFSHPYFWSAFTSIGSPW